MLETSNTDKYKASYW